ncbi:MAG: hypothetical protein AB1714_01100 [Acidobacteriota bacterium]
MSNSARFIPVLLISGVAACSNVFAQAPQVQAVDDLMSLIKSRSGLSVRLPDAGWQWKEADVQGTPDRGEITFSDAKWLMYLIHWGPIQRPQVTVDYVRARMSKMWGVNFEFTGAEGPTTVNGHEAVMVEAHGTNRMFYTRFIAWNCPESNREFIADTNYNTARKTPVNDFEIETRSAKTIRCHAPFASDPDPDLATAYSADTYGFSFRYPSRWFLFESPYYVPFPQYEGVRGQRLGSLLALCSDENIRVTLKWGPNLSGEGESSPMGDPVATRRLRDDMASQSDVDEIRVHGFENYYVGNKKIGRIWGTCGFKEAPAEEQSGFYTGEGVFQAAEWSPGAASRRVAALLVTKQYRYGTAESSPGRELLDRVLLDLILSMK